eukprot:1768964-Amphidinium_carterae.1
MLARSVSTVTLGIGCPQNNLGGYPGWLLLFPCCLETDSRDFSCGDVGKLHAKSGVRCASCMAAAARALVSCCVVGQLSRWGLRKWCCGVLRLS